MAPAHTIKTLELTIGYNKSDATFGWKGFDNGLTLYYLRIGFKWALERNEFEFSIDFSPRHLNMYDFESKEALTKSSFPVNIHIHLLMGLVHLLGGFSSWYFNWCIFNNLTSMSLKHQCKN